jgi:Fe-S-cluster containining protein
MVAGSGRDEQLCKKVAEIYDWLESRITDVNQENQCSACGRCCDFEGYDHRLFVTVPELKYLAENIGHENVRPMPTGKCPYNIEGKCTVYEYRFASCRIFSCGGDVDFQSELSELTLQKLRCLCEELEIPYLYRELAFALNDYL